MKIKTSIKTILLTSFLSLSSYGQATMKSQSLQNIWQIKPTVCLVEVLGQACEMSLYLNINNQLVVSNKTRLQGQQYCLFQDQEKLVCFKLVDTNVDSRNITNAPIYALRLLPLDSPSTAHKELKFSETSEGLTLHLVINDESQLILQDNQANIVYRQTLSIKARKSSKKTRRVREPWSLF